VANDSINLHYFPVIWRVCSRNDAEDEGAGSPELIPITNFDNLRIADLLFYGFISLFWLVYSLHFFYFRRWRIQNKQKERKKAEQLQKGEIEHKHDHKVTEFYLSKDQKRENRRSEMGTFTTMSALNKMKSMTNVTHGVDGGTEALLHAVLKPSMVFEGDYLYKALEEAKTFKQAGPTCQDYPIQMSAETIRMAHHSWTFAETRHDHKKSKKMIPGWSDEGKLVFLFVSFDFFCFLCHLYIQIRIPISYPTGKCTVWVWVDHHYHLSARLGFTTALLRYA
jgi:hypothetical protein